MEKHILSKSTFIKGHQCLKSLYLHKKRPFLRDKLSAEQLAKFKRGHKVGDMAQQLFPGGIDVSPKSPSQYQKSAILTQELIASGQEIIYEATFQFNKVLVMLDILVKTEKGWAAYEVKSSLKLSETYFTDAAVQYYVITNSGLKLDSFFLVYVDENYIQAADKEIDVQAYFIKQEVKEELLEKQTQIAKEIEEELAILTEKHSPKVEVGAHCFEPYTCDFIGFCWKNKSRDLFKIPALNYQERTSMLNKGVFELNEIKNQINDNTLALKQLDCLAANTNFITDNLKEKLASFPEDVLFLAFVNRKPAVPDCEGSKPYQTQLFSYALLQNNESKSAIYSGVCDDYKAFIKSFSKSLNSTARIIVYDRKELEEAFDSIISFFPEFENETAEILRKTTGIKQWILKGDFYFVGLKYDLLLKEVAAKTLNNKPFSKPSIGSDILAINAYEIVLEKKGNFSDADEKAILEYMEISADYVKQIIIVLMELNQIQ